MMYSGAMELSVSDLVCERGGREVFAGVGFAIAAGEMLELRGPNGAGKTSLLRLIAGLNEAAGGDLQLNGVAKDMPVATYCHFIGHQDAFKPALTVYENLEFWRDFFGGGDIEAALEAFSLDRLAGYSAALLSAGQKRRLALGRLVMIERPLWLLDEPSVGLDKTSVAQLQALMRQHLAADGMIIATTHIDLGMENAKVFDFADLEAG